MKIRVHSQRFVRLALTGMIGLGLTLALAVFMLASTGLAAPPLAVEGQAPLASPAADASRVDRPSAEGEIVLTAPEDETDLWQSRKEGRSLTAEASPSPQDMALRADAIRRSQDALAALSPTILLTEDFSTASGATPPTGWTNNIIDGEAGVDRWRFDNPGNRTLTPPLAAPAAIFDSDAVSWSNGQPEDVALESPPFDASAYVYVGLDFDQYFRFSYATITEIFVEVYDGAQWQTVYSVRMETPGSATE
jgi:hypothetical protein